MTEINWIEVLERVEQAIATLTTRRVADGYELELSGKALASWEEGGGVLEFSRQSGIPLDWLLRGDVGALICASAAGSTRSELTQACGAPPIRPSWVLMIDHPTPNSFCLQPRLVLDRHQLDRFQGRAEADRGGLFWRYT